MASDTRSKRLGLVAMAAETGCVASMVFGAFLVGAGVDGPAAPAALIVALSLAVVGIACDLMLARVVP